MYGKGLVPAESRSIEESAKLYKGLYSAENQKVDAGCELTVVRNRREACSDFFEEKNLPEGLLLITKVGDFWNHRNVTPSANFGDFVGEGSDAGLIKPQMDESGLTRVSSELIATCSRLLTDDRIPLYVRLRKSL